MLNRLPSWLEVRIVGRYANEQQTVQRLREAWWDFSKLNGFKSRFRYLEFLANSRVRRIGWSPTKVYDVMKDSDIGILPIDTSDNAADDGDPFQWKVKSENRLTLKWQSASRW